MQTSRLVVLAAGVGSRLQPRVSAKALVRVGGMTLLERSIVAAHEAGFDDVVVVTGHQPERVAREALDVSRRRGLRVAVVHNARYREGNGLSVLAAKDIVGDPPFALVMADHVFASALLRRLRATSVPPGEVVVVVDRSLGRAAGVDPADAMKVRLSGDRVEAIGKMLPAYDAFDVGAFVCSAAVLDAVEQVAASGDTAFAAAVRVLAGRGTARALLLEADQVTIAAFAVALVAAAALAAHAPVLAAVLVMAASVLDGSDGEVARLAHRSSRFGSFLDLSPRPAKPLLGVSSVDACQTLDSRGRGVSSSRTGLTECPDLRRAVDAKLAITRHRHWRSGLWRQNLDSIEQQWEATMASWVDPEKLPLFAAAVEDPSRRLRELRLD